nr:hypothetical protein Itr_chr12CG15710 [Ipomoea trifida]GMD57163.1 hypothetical protein Iba_chr11eCG10110 [Ipomoea batatas]
MEEAWGSLLQVALPPVFPFRRETEDKEERDAAAASHASSMPSPLTAIVTVCWRGLLEHPRRRRKMKIHGCCLRGR